MNMEHKLLALQEIKLQSSNGTTKLSYLVEGKEQIRFSLPSTIMQILLIRNSFLCTFFSSIEYILRKKEGEEWQASYNENYDGVMNN